MYGESDIKQSKFCHSCVCLLPMISRMELYWMCSRSLQKMPPSGLNKQLRNILARLSFAMKDYNQVQLS